MESGCVHPPQRTNSDGSSISHPNIIAICQGLVQREAVDSVLSSETLLEPAPFFGEGGGLGGGLSALGLHCSMQGLCCSTQAFSSFGSSVQFSCSVVSDSVTPRTAACQASLSITNSRSLLKLMSIESVMPSNHLTLCHPLLLLPSIFPSIRVFSNESVLHIRWPRDWSLSFSISPSNEYSGLISFRSEWISLQSKGLSRVFSNTTTQKHQFFSAQLYLLSNSHIHIQLLEKP